MNRLSKILLVISLITYISVFSMNLSAGNIGGNETIYYIVMYIEIFWPLAVQSIIVMLSISILIYCIIKKCNGIKYRILYISILSSGVFVTIYIYVWVSLISTGIH